MAAVVNPTVVQFTAPTKYSDGTVMPPGEIVKFQYGFGTAAGSYTQVVDDADLTVNAQGLQSGAVPQTLAVGNWFANVRSVTKDGATSNWGNEVAFSVQAKVPTPVSDFTVA